MALYCLSDVHLRLDRPERGEKLARLVDRLGSDDDLIVAGDLGDFWFASRQARRDPLACPGLRALAEFRSRGGRLRLIAGNHDAGAGPAFERALGVGFEPQPLDVRAFDLAIRLAHGHRVGRVKPWKKAMETRAFLAAFALLPEPVARLLETRLDRSNEQTRSLAEARLVAGYRAYADRLADSVDLLVVGHVHDVVDDASRRPRLVVLGDWIEGASYLKIDEDGARLVIEERSPRHAGRTPHQ